MKYAQFVLLILSLVLVSHQPASSQNCTDPAGCSAVSFAAYQHTLGVIQFGNSTGKVISKKKVDYCPEANCNSFFIMTTGLIAPNSSTGVNQAATAADITLIAVRRALATVQTGVFRNTVDVTATGFRQVPARTKFSSFPFSMGFGNNAIAFLSLSGNQNRFVSQRFNPTGNTLTQTITTFPAFPNELASAINREGSFALSVNRTKAESINLNVKKLNQSSRRPIGGAEVNILNFATSQQRTDTIPAIAISNEIKSASPISKADEPSASRLWAAYAYLRRLGADHRSAINIVNIEYGIKKPTLKARTLGVPIAISNFKATSQATSHFYQSVALDSQARFVLFADYSTSCKKLILKFQRINPLTGRKIGAPKILLGCPDVAASSTGVYGIQVINLQ